MVLMLGTALAEPPTSDDGAELAARCANGDARQCVEQALFRLQQGETDARANLDELCGRGVDDACGVVALLAAGAPPRAGASQRVDGGMEPGEVWRRCYWPRVLRGGDPWGDLRGTVQYAPDGRFEGAAFQGRYVDDELERCVSEYAASLVVAPTPRGVRAHYSWPLDHGAVVHVDERRVEDAPAHALERCFDAGFEGRVVVRVGRRTRWIERGPSEDADTCVLRIVEGLGVSGVISVVPHQPARPAPRPFPPSAARELRRALPLARYVAARSLPLGAPTRVTCEADLTVEADGYASRVDLRGCPEDLYDAIVGPLMSWQFVVSEPTLATLRYELGADEARILAERRTLVYTSSGMQPPPVGSGSLK